MACVSPVLPIHPCGPPQDLINFVQDVLLPIAGGTNLHPERDELIRSDGPTFIHIHLVEHRISADIRKSSLEESVSLFSCDSVTAVRIHHVKQLLNCLPSVSRELACYGPFGERL